MASWCSRKKIKTMTLSVEKICAAAKTLDGVALHTPLQYNVKLSEEFICNIYLKGED